MNIVQKEFYLSPRNRGFHIVTDEVLENIREIIEGVDKGLAHIFICHTSASLTLNENVSPDVRVDFESHFNEFVPEGANYYLHTIEGSDDMPAHIKSSILGNSLSVPVKNGKFNLGTWQGIYLCEHRNNGGARKLVVTILGD